MLRETGLLPHVNAGVMGAEDIRLLRAASASQGLMLESTSARLLDRGQAHHDCPDKVRRNTGTVHSCSACSRAGCTECPTTKRVRCFFQHT